MFFTTPTLSPFTFAKYKLYYLRVHVHFRFWEMRVLALCTWTLAASLGFMHMDLGSVALAASQWDSPWAFTRGVSHAQPIRPSFDLEKNVKKLYSVTYHFGAEEVVSENYSEITLFWSFKSEVSLCLQVNTQYAMPGEGRWEPWLRVHGGLQEGWSGEMSSVREIIPLLSCHSWSLCIG